MVIGLSKIVMKGKFIMISPRMKKITHDSMRQRRLNNAILIFGHISENLQGFENDSDIIRKLL